MNTMVSYELVHNPKLFNSTAIGRNMSKTAQGGFRSQSTKPMMQLSAAPARVAVNHPQTTSHWISNYRNVSNIVASRERVPSRRPTWSINRQAYSSARCNYMTEFGDSIGKYGHNPRDNLPFEATKQANKNNELTVGTAKVTSHIPGYNGFIPQTEINELANK